MLEKVSGLFKSGSDRRAVRGAAVDLYEAIVAAAREPALYVQGGVPDTVDGRFDSVALHSFLLMDRMSGSEGWTRVGEALADRIVADMDQSLREMGIGDMSIGKKVKAAASQLYGRFDVYWGALRSDDPKTALAEALARNLFRGLELSDMAVERLVTYINQQRAYLAELENEDILKGRLSFMPAEQTALGQGDAAG